MFCPSSATPTALAFPAVDTSWARGNDPRPMAKKKSHEALPTQDHGNPQRELLEALQRLSKEVEALNQQVGTLTEQSQVLTAAIDDVRQEIEISWSYYLHFLRFLAHSRSSLDCWFLIGRVCPLV